MPARRDLDRDKLIELYKSGESIQAIAAYFGVAYETAELRLKETGIPLRSRAESVALVRRRKRARLMPEAEVTRLFNKGTSVKAMAEHFGVSRRPVQERLKEMGFELRSGSEANSIRMAKLSPKERKALVKEANQAARGRVRSEAELIKAAQSRFERFRADGAFDSPYQRDLAEALTQSGIEFTLELPVGPYNLDIAITGCAVAVELHGGGWHRYGTHWKSRPKRMEYLLSRGWLVIEVWQCDSSEAVGKWEAPALADKVITLSELYRRDPAACGQHWMLRGNGHLTTGLRSEGHDVASITGTGRSGKGTEADRGVA